MGNNVNYCRLLWLFLHKRKKVWYIILMTKLQSIVAEIKTLPVEEQREVVSQFAHLVTAGEDGFFELTDEELTELDRRMLNVDNEPTFTPEEVFAILREKYVQGDMA